MALKGDRDIYMTNPDFICDVAAEAGQVLIIKATQPSGRGVGQAINDAAPVATLSSSPPSGTVVAGLLLTDVQDIDEAVQHRNYQKVTQVKNENACLLTNGYVWTNKITGTPAIGGAAYLAANGTLGTSQTNSIPAVGEWKSSKDTDGYAKVYIKLV